MFSCEQHAFRGAGGAGIDDGRDIFSEMALRRVSGRPHRRFSADFSSWAAPQLLQKYKRPARWALWAARRGSCGRAVYPTRKYNGSAWLKMYSYSVAEMVGYIGTSMMPSCWQARSMKCHSGRLVVDDGHLIAFFRQAPVKPKLRLSAVSIKRAVEQVVNGLCLRRAGSLPGAHSPTGA